MITQDTDTIPKLKKMKTKRNKIKKEKKKKLKKGLENPESDSESDNLDLSQPLYPLSYYVSDQEDLVNQMFATIRGSKLQAMLPPVLKSIPLKELKRLCLHELQGMSKKRIICTINSQEMEGSSGSDEEEEEEEAKEEVKTTSEREAKSNRQEKRQAGSDNVVPDYLLKKIKVEPGLEANKEGAQEPKSVMELLELQMRARIIKTMLEKDDGKKLTEDAIAAVIGNTKLTELRNVQEEQALKNDEGTHSKEQREPNVSAERKSRSSSHRREQGIRSDDRRSKRRQSSHDQRKREHSGSSDYGDDKKVSKHSYDTDLQVRKKKKISRKEFEERMRRAKKNRTYRQRKVSEDEDKVKDYGEENPLPESKDEKEENRDNQKESNAESQSVVAADSADKDKAGDKTAKEVEAAEVSEKEEGEWDSNEEEEGACTPSDITGASDFDSSPGNRRRSYSRSWTRSYSRSPSRTRGRRRRRRRSYSRSYSRSSSRSYSSRSRSRSRSIEKRKREGPGSNKRLYEGRNKEAGKLVNVNDTSSKQKAMKEEEENWGQKCDIEFVDSEEDFDEIETVKKGSIMTKQLSPTPKEHITERASISFSLQKKPAPNITPNVDLDDLPLKSTHSGNIALKSKTGAGVEVRPSQEKTADEIVISSDSETEDQAVKKSIKGRKMLVSSSEMTGDASIDLTQNGDNLKKLQEENPVLKEIQERDTGKMAREGPKADRMQETKLPEIQTVTKVLERESVGKTTEDEEKEESEVISPDENREELLVDKNKCKDHMESLPQSNEKESIGRENKDSVILPKEHSSTDFEKEHSSDDNEQEVKADDHQGSTENEKTPENDQKGNLEGMKNKSVDQEERNVHSEATQVETDKSQYDKEQGEQDSESEIIEPDNSEVSELTVAAENTLHQENTEVSQLNLETEEQNITRVSDEAKKINENESENFYKGAENLQFSDEDSDKNNDGEEGRSDGFKVQPIRIEMGLIRKPVVKKRKIDMTIPEKSWGKKDKKNWEKSKETLLIEGVGYLKSTLSENSASTSTQEKSDVTENTSDSEKTKKTQDNQYESVAATSESLGEVNSCSKPHTSQDFPETSVSSQDDLVGYEDYEPNNDSDNKKKGDSETEIIGVIEANTDSNADQLDLELGGSSWSMRWLQSENVQKVVTSSKMFSRVRKKIQKKDRATKATPVEKADDSQKKIPEPPISVIGSIEEYERLFGMKVTKPEEEEKSEIEQNAKVASENTKVVEDIPKTSQKVPTFGSDDEGEDSEEEALWSKIIGK